MLQTEQLINLKKQKEMGVMMNQLCESPLGCNFLSTTARREPITDNKLYRCSAHYILEDEGEKVFNELRKFFGEQIIKEVEIWNGVNYVPTTFFGEDGCVSWWRKLFDIMRGKKDETVLP